MGDASLKGQKLDDNSLCTDVNDEDASWKRSQSDASFFLAGAASKASNPGSNGRTDNISEHSAVYWNIAEAVEESAILSTKCKFSPFGTPGREHTSSTGTTKYPEVDIPRKPELPLSSGIARSSELHKEGSEFIASDENLRRQSSLVLSTQEPNLRLTDLSRRPLDDKWSGTTSSVYTYHDKQYSRQAGYSYYLTTGATGKSSLSKERHGSKQILHSPPTNTVGASLKEIHLRATNLMDIKRHLLTRLATLRALEGSRHYAGDELYGAEGERALKALDTCDEFLNMAGSKSTEGEAEPLLREMCDAVLTALHGFLESDSTLDSEPWVDYSNNDLSTKPQTPPPSTLSLAEETRIQAKKITVVQAQGISLSVPTKQKTGKAHREPVRHLAFRSAQVLNRILRIADVTSLSKEDRDERERIAQSNIDSQEHNNEPGSLEHSDPKHTPFQTGICDRILEGSRKNRSDDALYAEFLAVLEPLLQKTKELNLEKSVVLRELISELMFACRSTAIPTLRQAALNLVNLTVFGDVSGQQEVIIIWLSTLALHPDAVVQYFAFLTALFLFTKRGLTTTVLNSGILDQIRPFVRTNPPKEFAQNQLIHAFFCVCRTPDTTSQPLASCYHCYAKATQGWLQHLLPAFSSSCSEARIMAAFHFVATSSLRPRSTVPSIVSEKGDVSFETGQDDAVLNEALIKLYQIACSIDPLESELGLTALKCWGKELPHQLTPHVPSWSASDVCIWLERTGFKDLCEQFIDMNIDGTVLLSLDDFHLQHGLNITNSITRLKFLRSLTRLKLEADYSSIDHTNLSEWLLWATTLIPNFKQKGCVKFTKAYDSLAQPHAHRIEPTRNLRQYTHNLVAAGMDRMHLSQLTNETLLNDCHIHNGLHRTQMLTAVQIFQSAGLEVKRLPLPDSLDHTEVPNRELDAFISYRRSNGDRLASLVRAHLLARNYTVFLDVLSMPAGKFDESIQAAIRNANNFILILTSNALDRCRKDTKCQDWIHREIVLAMESKCNIIPVFDGNFEWPNLEELPEDMRQIHTYHGIIWGHAYQDAGVDELERLMKVRHTFRVRLDDAGTSLPLTVP